MKRIPSYYSRATLAAGASSPNLFRSNWAREMRSPCIGESDANRVKARQMNLPVGFDVKGPVFCMDAVTKALKAQLFECWI